MNPQEVFCPNLACYARGQQGKGNNGGQSQQEKRYLCHECGQPFVARKGSIFYRLPTDPKTGLPVLALLVYGCPMQAIVKAFGVDPGGCRSGTPNGLVSPLVAGGRWPGQLCRSLPTRLSFAAAALGWRKRPTAAGGVGHQPNCAGGQAAVRETFADCSLSGALCQARLPWLSNCCAAPRAAGGSPPP